MRFLSNIKFPNCTISNNYCGFRSELFKRALYNIHRYLIHRYYDVVYLYLTDNRGTAQRFGLINKNGCNAQVAGVAYAASYRRDASGNVCKGMHKRRRNSRDVNGDEESDRRSASPWRRYVSA
jgi:hypothetical protein